MMLALTYSSRRLARALRTIRSAPIPTRDPSQSRLASLARQFREPFGLGLVIVVLSFLSSFPPSFSCFSVYLYTSKGRVFIFVPRPTGSARDVSKAHRDQCCWG